MSPENQRIAIARACDYRPDPETGLWYGLSGEIVAGFNPRLHEIEELPDYLGSLDAMAEAETVLTDSQEMEYEDRLAEVLKVGDAGCDWQESSFYRLQMIRAKAPQRAEAFIKTLGLWTED